MAKGKFMRNKELRAITHAIWRFMEAVPNPEILPFSEQGIVLVGGAQKRYRTSFWVAIHSIRRVDSTIPIEIWFPEDELPSCDDQLVLAQLKVSIRIFEDLFPEGTEVMLEGYEYKLLALTFSSFSEVLFMDSDNLVLRSPKYLFHSASYRQYGSLVWKDFWLASRAEDARHIGAQQLPGNLTHESGQMLVDKQRCWPILMLACYMNSFPSLFYPMSVNYMGLGDKEIFPLAAKYLGMNYGLVDEGPDHVGVWTDRALVFGNTMLQHDEEGRATFLHANVGKWTAHVPHTFDSYLRRWQFSMLHGSNISQVIFDAAGIDLERWIYELIYAHRCDFDRSPPFWYERLEIGPLLDGMYLTDHYNINTNLRIFRRLVAQGYSFN